MNIGGETKEEAAADARKAVDEGFPAVKDHFYHSRPGEPGLVRGRA